MFVREEVDPRKPALNNHFGALVAGEKRRVHGAALQVRRGFVHDGIHLSMTNKRKFCFFPLAVPTPRHTVVVATVGHAVVTQCHDPVVSVHDAGADFCIRVFASLRRQTRQCHKIIIPGQVIGRLAAHYNLKSVHMLL